MKNSLWALFYCLSLLLPNHITAQEITIHKAIQYHDIARAGDKESIEQAVASFTKLLQQSPKDPLVLAYLGSSYALLARESSAVADKVRFTNRGLRYLDQSVVIAPEDVTVRLIRGTVSSNLPALFSREASAIEDFLYLDSIYSSQPNVSLAHSMIDIYTKLVDLVPEQKEHWEAKIQEAQKRANQ